MAKPGKIPNFKKIYPEADKKVIQELKKSERKMQYQEYDIKKEIIVIDQDMQTTAVVPGREDSIDRLMEINYPLRDDAEELEEQAIRNVLAEQLGKAVKRLLPKDQQLIADLYVWEKSERQIAKEYGISQNMVHKRKKQVLAHLKHLLEKNFKNFGFQVVKTRSQRGIR